MKKFIFFVFLIVLLFLVPVTLIRATPLSLVLANSGTISNFIQRGFGLAAFIILFVEIILGAFIQSWVKKLGEWVSGFYIFLGTFVYIVALLHPLTLLAHNHFVGLGLSPYPVFINVCLLCQTPLYLYYTFGMIAFWILTFVFLAGLIKAGTPWLTKNSRLLYLLNCVVFLIAGVHGFLAGTDFKVQPFYSFGLIAYLIIAGIIVFVEVPKLYRSFRVWLKS